MVRFSWALTTLLNTKVSSTTAMTAIARSMCFIAILLYAVFELKETLRSIAAHAEVHPEVAGPTAWAMRRLEAETRIETQNNPLQSPQASQRQSLPGSYLPAERLNGLRLSTLLPTAHWCYCAPRNAAARQGRKRSSARAVGRAKGNQSIARKQTRQQVPGEGSPRLPVPNFLVPDFAVDRFSWFAIPSSIRVGPNHSALPMQPAIPGNDLDTQFAIGGRPFACYNAPFGGLKPP